jgi:hypothetical protein
MNNVCCGVEMQFMGLINGKQEPVECYRCNECGQGINVVESKFENGKLRADGMNGRYDQKVGPIDVEPRLDVNVSDRQDRYCMNLMIDEVVRAKKVGMVVKTREQRNAELSAILGRHVG